MACPVKILILFAFNCVVALWGLVEGNKTVRNRIVDIVPQDEFPYLVHEGEAKRLQFGVQNRGSETLGVNVKTTHNKVAEVENGTFQISSGNSNFSVKVMGKFLGRTFIKISVSENTKNGKAEKDYDVHSGETEAEDQFDWYELPEKYEIAVGRNEGALSHSFTGMVIILVCLANVAMGCKTELSVVKEVLKKPIAPLTGMFSQFILMPMVSNLEVLLFFCLYFMTQF